MTKRRTGYAAATLAASLVLGGISTVYGDNLTLAGFGADQEVVETASQAVDEAQTEKAAAPKEEVKETEAKETEVKETEAGENPAKEEASEDPEEKKEQPQAEEPATEQEIDRSVVETTGFAKADDYINVRASGDTEGEVVGTLQLNDSVYIEDVDENGWYKVRSGNVEGYVAGYLIATGEEAEEIAKTAAYTYAKIGAEYLNVRADASEDGEVLDTVGQEADLEVVEDLGDWVKVVTSDGVYGYVSTEYVSTETVYPTGETVEEKSEREEQEDLEAAQLEEEYAAYVAEQEEAVQGTPEEVYSEDGYTEDAAAETYTEDAPAQTYTEDAAAQTYTEDASAQTYTEDAAAETYTDTAYTDTTDTAYTDTTTADSSVQASSSDVDALYQAYLVAQEAAMNPTDEEDATTKANAAIDAYNAYLAASGSTETVASVESAPAETQAADTTYTEDGTTETYTDAGTTETYTDAGTTETYTDAGTTETYTDAGTTETYTDAGTTETYTDTAAAQTYQEETTQTEAPSTDSSGSGVGSQIASYASQFVGNPYVYGGTSLTNGADCSGFTMSVFSNFGISLPHNAAAQSGCGTPVSMSDLQAGDLLFYGDGGIGHVAIYTGDGNVVHASNPENGIKTSAYNYRTPVAAVRCT